MDVKGQSHFTLRALSFNIWGVPVSIDRPKRILSFCHHLAVPDQYDVVGIQVAPNIFVRVAGWLLALTSCSLFFWLCRRLS